MWYKNGTVFNSQQDIRRDNPNTSLPSFMSDEFIDSMGYTQVMDTPNPATTLQHSYQDGVEVVNGVPMVKWKVVDKTEEELSNEAKIFTEESYIEEEEAKEEALANLKVTTASGKVFYADLASRLDIEQAINIAVRNNLISTSWKLAEPFEGSKIVEVALLELQEASYLALSAKAQIIGVV